MDGRSRGAQLVKLAQPGPFHRFFLHARELNVSGRTDEALAAADAYEWIAQAFGDETTVGFLIQNRMYTYLFTQRYGAALAIGEELLSRHRAAGNVLDEGQTLADLAELYMLTGRFTEGTRYLARAGLLLEGTTRRNRRYVAALHCYGDAAKAAWLYEVAAAVYEEHYATSSPEPDAYFEHAYTTLLVSWALWLDNLGHTHEAAQRFRRAEAIATRWLDRYAETGGAVMDARTLTGIRALALAKLGDVDRAIAMVEPIVHTLTYGAGWMGHLALGVARRARGDLRGARREILAAQQGLGFPGRPEERLLLQYELAMLAAETTTDGAGTDLITALRAHAYQLWQQRLQRLSLLQQARRQEELEIERAQAEAALLRDPLTGLGNRRKFDLMMNGIDAGAVELPLTLLVIDVDNFKTINDTHSHSVGDHVLREISSIIGSHCRTGIDIPVRYAGDEFTVFLNADLPAAVGIAGRIRAAVAVTGFDHITRGTPVSISTGVAALRAGMTAANLFEAADGNLYRAKRAGRDRVAA